MPWRHIEGMEVYLHSFLTLALDGGERWISCLSRFIPLGKSHQCHLRSRRMGRCSWYGLFGSKVLLLLGSEPQIIQPIAQLLTVWHPTGPMVAWLKKLYCTRNFFTNLQETGSQKERMWHITVMTLLCHCRRGLCEGRLQQTHLEEWGSFSGHNLGRKICGGYFCTITEEAYMKADCSRHTWKNEEVLVGTI